MNLIMLGPPGSGKGTQARQLSRLLGAEVLDVGSVLRKEAEFNASIKCIMNSGGLLSDGIVNNIVKDKMLPIISNMVLDGFPRTVVQARFLDDMLGDYDVQIDHVIRLEVANDVLVKRLSQRLSCSVCGAIYSNKKKCCSECGGALTGRDDDCLEIVKLRLIKYHETGKELVEYYGDKVLNIDGNGTMLDVMKKIMLKVGFCA